MDDYALVLNAGSSSLKFCVYRRPDSEKWRLDAGGQIEGIGTSPRFSAKDAHGGILADRTIWMIGCLMAARPSMLWHPGFAPNTVAHECLGVGHRVVHGGARYAQPTIVDPASPGRAMRIDSSGAVASAAQPVSHRRRSSSECPACRKSPASTRAFIRGIRRLRT